MKTAAAANQFSSMMHEDLSDLRVSVLTSECQRCALGVRQSIHTGTCTQTHTAVE